MGLDMYLKRKIYLGANYEHNKVEGTVNLTKQGQPVKVDVGRISEIIEQVGYWRKANHIHDWFVRNVQDGLDDCQESYVSSDALKRLLSDCKTVLADKSKAAELLPTKHGFFFGGTEYNEYYYSDIEDTIKIVELCLCEDSGDYYYQSSW